MLNLPHPQWVADLFVATTVAYIAIGTMWSMTERLRSFISRQRRKLVHARSK